MIKTVTVIVAALSLTACAGSPAHNLIAGNGAVCTMPSCSVQSNTKPAVVNQLETTTPVATTRNSAPIKWNAKGYELGQTMAACPVNTISKEQNTNSNVTICNLGPTTYAGSAAAGFAVILYKQEVIGIMINLSDKGRYANSEVAAALVEKLGVPSSSKSHVNEYMWFAGDKAVSFDGWKGTVVFADVAKNKQAKASRVAAAKNDM